MLAPERANGLDRFSTFGDLLKYLRRRAGLTQRQLSIAVGYSFSQISRLELNQRGPDLATVQARFIPALGLQDEPEIAARLEALAAAVQAEDTPQAGLAPYKGLQHYDEPDAEWFFGREALVERLVARALSPTLTATASPHPEAHDREEEEGARGRGSETFLAIIGASGSGKSSVVRAGLIPAMRRLGWGIYLLTPTAHPLVALAASALGPAPAQDRRALAEAMARDTGALRAALSHAGPSRRLLVVVDQLEELFTLCHAEAEREAFVGNLLAAADEAEYNAVVVALRADFYGHCAAFPALRDALAACQEYIGPMSAGELRRAIEGPSRRGGWQLEPGLADLILRDVNADGDRPPEPGALPLLSHVLLETWSRRSGRTLTLAGYAAAGGVRGAIAETAEAVWHDQLDVGQQEIARAVFLSLVGLGSEPGEAETRRRAPLDELLSAGPDAAAVHEVLTVLADARLVITEADAVEVAHEALIREWPRLHDWLEASRERLQLRRRLAQAAAEWSAAGRDSSYLLSGVRLAQVVDSLNGQESELTAPEQAYLAASVAERQRRAGEEEERRAREARLQKRMRGVLQLLAGLSLLAALAGGGLAWWANGQRQSALANLRSSEAQRLAAEANRLFIQNSDHELGALLALQSLQQGYTPQGDEALTRAARFDYPIRMIDVGPAGVFDLAFTADSARLVTAGIDKVARLWDVANGREVMRFEGHTATVMGIDISPDGRVVATGSIDDTLRLWDAATGRELRRLAQHGEVHSLHFSADGRRLLTGSSDDTVRIWDVATGQELRRFVGHTGDVDAVAFSPDERLVVSAGADMIVRIWDTATGQQLQALAGHRGEAIYGVAFAPDGRSVASGACDNTVRLWDVATGKQIQQFQHEGCVCGLAFSPDGRYLLSGAEDSAGHLWDLTTGQEVRRLTQTGTVSTVGFSPDGRLAVLGGLNPAVRLWSMEAQPIQRDFGQGTDIAFSPDGRILLVGRSDSTADLRDVVTGATLATLRHPGGSVQKVGYSADGRVLMTTSADGVIQLWGAAEQLPLTKIVVPGGLFVAALSPDGAHVAAGASNEPDVTVWDAATGRQLHDLTFSTPARGLGFSWDSRQLALAFDDGTLRVVEVTSGREVLPAMPGNSIGNPAFSRDGRYLVGVGGDGAVQLYDAQTGAKLRDLVGHASVVWDSDFSPDGRYVATASIDGSVRLWDVAAGREVRRLIGQGGTAFAVNYSPDGKRVATAGDTVRVWMTDIAQVEQAMCRALPRDLTDTERARYGLTQTGPTCPGSGLALGTASGR